MPIVQSRLFRYCIPLTQPIRFNDKTLSERTGLVVELTFTDGTKGVGDIAPLDGFSEESLDDCQNRLIPLLEKAPALSIQAIFDSLDNIPRAAAFGLHCALARVSYQINNQLCIVPLLKGDSSAVLSQYQQRNCPELIKLKVARYSLTEEIDLIHRLLALNPAVKFNLDANRQWLAADAKQLLAAVPNAAINYLEEPCDNLQTSFRVAKDNGVKIALDETLQRKNFTLSTDVSEESLPLIKAFILKPTLLGGFNRCKTLIQQAQVNGIDCFLSSSFESSLGIAQLTNLSQLWLPGQAAGLDTLCDMPVDVIVVSATHKPCLKFSDLECVWQS